MRHRKIVLGLALLLLLCFGKPAFATDDFSTNYDVTYDVAESGKTHITQHITLINLQNGTYAKEYTLTITSVTPQNIKAYTNIGLLTTDVKSEGNKTAIQIPFKDKVIGKDKSFSWTIEYDADNVVVDLGKVKTVTIPRIGVEGAVGRYNLIAKIPASFGEPASISPKPSQVTKAQKVIYAFSQDDVLKQGVNAIFGDKQYVAFSLQYHLTNPNVVKIKHSIVLPPTTELQQVMIDKIYPEPSDIRVDDDGNWLADYIVNRGANLAVTVTGEIVLAAKPAFNQKVIPAILQKERLADSYWESDNTKIISLITELTKQPGTSADFPDPIDAKAHAIFQFVAGSLTAPTDEKQKNLKRKGGLANLEQRHDALAIDFADTFVALSRAAQIPARVVVGFTFDKDQALDSENQTGQKPAIRQSQHVWAQYYTEKHGWRSVDPTLTVHSGGSNYFDSWDLQHIVFGFWGIKPDSPIPAGFIDPETTPVSLALTQPFAIPKPTIVVKAQVTTPSFIGLPARGNIIIENQSNVAIIPATIAITNPGVRLLSDISQTAVIPPKGSQSIGFTYTADTLFRFSQEQITVVINGQSYAVPLQVARTQADILRMFVLPIGGGIFIGLLLYIFFRARVVRRLKKPPRKTTVNRTGAL